MSTAFTSNRIRKLHLNTDFCILLDVWSDLGECYYTHSSWLIALRFCNLTFIVSIYSFQLHRLSYEVLSLILGRLFRDIVIVDQCIRKECHWNKKIKKDNYTYLTVIDYTVQCTYTLILQTKCGHIVENKLFQKFGTPFSTSCFHRCVGFYGCILCSRTLLHFCHV